jgi:lactate dehydrogenase-like 2-hydroxyacid dehydrogenase
MPEKMVVLVSRPPHAPEALKALYDHFKVRINDGSPYSKDQYCKAPKDADGLFCDSDEIDADLMDYASKLQVIANFGVGYNNIDVYAALDVFEDEPDISKELLNAANTVVTPHLASGTYETRGAMTERCCTNLIMGLNGKIPKDLVNPPWEPRK